MGSALLSGPCEKQCRGYRMKAAIHFLEENLVAPAVNDGDIHFPRTISLAFASQPAAIFLAKSREIIGSFSSAKATWLEPTTQ